MSKRIKLALDSESTNDAILETLVSSLALQHTIAELLANRLRKSGESTEALFDFILKRMHENALKVVENLQIRRGRFDFDDLLGDIDRAE